MSKVQCFECHDCGHYKRNFSKLIRKRKERHHTSTTNDEESSKNTNHDEIDLFNYSSLTGIVEDEMWLIDSGASRHMTCDHIDL
jgi:Zn ribbon nucleic-acid-binding protein